MRQRAPIGVEHRSDHGKSNVEVKESTSIQDER